jgi:hypothetical protein
MLLEQKVFIPLEKNETEHQEICRDFKSPLFKNGTNIVFTRVNLLLFI